MSAEKYLPKQYLNRGEYVKLSLEKRLIPLSKTEDERAKELHTKLIKIDMHCHGAEQFPYTYLPHFPFSPPAQYMPHFPDGRIPLPLPQEVGEYLSALRVHPTETYYKYTKINWDGLKQSGVTDIQIVLGHITEDFERCIYSLGFSFADIEKNPLGKIARCADDIRAAKKEGKIAFMAATEANPFTNVMDRVDLLYGLGYRQAGMTYEHANYAGSGASDQRNGGLTTFGVRLVDRMNDLGMIIDLSHAGKKTTTDVIENSRDPVTLSHNGAVGVYPKGKRSRDDETLKALTQKHGLIGIGAVPNALSDAPRQGVKNWFDHVDYCVKLIGIDHVAVGMDNNWRDHVGSHKQSNPLGLRGFATEYMEGLENPTEAWHNITRVLVAEGYSDQEIEKIVGTNALRFIETVVG